MSSVVGEECTGSAAAAARAASGPPPEPSEEVWASLRPWRARGHVCLEAPVSSLTGAPLGTLVFCTTCGSIGHPGSSWGRSALASDCLGSRSAGRERQLNWILRGKHPSRRDGRVGSASALSDASRDFMASKLGLDEVPPLDPAPCSVSGVDLVRGLALFGFSSRASAEELGRRVLDRRKCVPDELEDEF